MSKLRETLFLEGKLPEYKICTQCNKNKKYDNYNLRISNNKTNLRCECKECSLKYSKKSYSKLSEEQKEEKRQYCRNWKNKNPKRYKEKNVLYKYKIDFNQFETLLKQQNYSCAICNKQSTKLKRSLCVDHCHTTNKVRGLLCDSCNNGLGRFKDNINNLKNAIKYLKQYR